MQQSPQRKSIQVFYAIDCRAPVPDLKAWILIHTSFNDSLQFTAHGVIAHEETPEMNFGHPVIEADAITPHEALELLKQKVNEPPKYNFPNQERLNAIKEAIIKKDIFTPTIPLFDTTKAKTMSYAPLPARVLMCQESKSILTYDSLVPADLAAEIARVPVTTIQSWQDSGKLQPAYVNSNHVMLRVRDVLDAAKV